MNKIKFYVEVADLKEAFDAYKHLTVDSRLAALYIDLTIPKDDNVNVLDVIHKLGFDRKTAIQIIRELLGYGHLEGSSMDHLKKWWGQNYLNNPQLISAQNSLIKTIHFKCKNFNTIFTLELVKKIRIIPYLYELRNTIDDYDEDDEEGILGELESLIEWKDDSWIYMDEESSSDSNYSDNGFSERTCPSCHESPCMCSDPY